MTRGSSPPGRAPDAALTTSRLLHPRGTPTRSPFIIGAIGHFIAGGMAIAYGTLVSFSFGWFPFVYSWSPGFVVSVLLSIALLLHSVGFYGMWRNYGLRIGAAAFACALVAPLILLASSVMAFESCGPPTYCYRSLGSFAAAISVIVGTILLGVMSIVDGFAFLSARRFVGASGNAFGAGVMFIIGGSFLASVLLVLVGGFFVLACALILGGVVLVQAPMPPTTRMPAPPSRFA